MTPKLCIACKQPIPTKQLEWAKEHGFRTEPTFCWECFDLTLRNDEAFHAKRLIREACDG